MLAEAYGVVIFGEPYPGLTDSRRGVSHVQYIVLSGLFCSVVSSSVLVICEPGRLFTKIKTDIDIRWHYIYSLLGTEAKYPYSLRYEARTSFIQRSRT